MASMKERVLAAATKTFDVVRCDVCGRWHKLDSDSFITLYGDITVGVKQDVINGNIDDKGKVVGSSIFCRTDGCWEKVVSLANEDQKAE